MMFIRHKILYSHEEQLQRGQQQADAILMSIFPPEVVEDMGLRGSLDKRPLVLRDVAECAILEADIVNFTSWTASNSARYVVKVLNSLFTRFDTLCEKYHVQRLKIVGDCIICMTTPHDSAHHARRMVELACEMLNTVNEFNKKQPERNKLSIRIGISAGPCITACIGKRKLSYEAVGVCVEEAQLMEKFATPGRAHVSTAVRDQILKLYPSSLSFAKVFIPVEDHRRQKMLEQNARLDISYEFDPEQYAAFSRQSRFQSMSHIAEGSIRHDPTQQVQQTALPTSLDKPVLPQKTTPRFWTKLYDPEWKTSADGTFDTDIFGFFTDLELERDFCRYLFVLENGAFLRLRQAYCIVLLACHIIARAMIVVPGPHSISTLYSAFTDGCMVGELSAISVIFIYSVVESLSSAHSNLQTIQTSQVVHIILFTVLSILNIASPVESLSNIMLASALDMMAVLYVSTLAIYTLRSKILLALMFFVLALLQLQSVNMLTIPNIFLLTIALGHTTSIHIAREVFSRRFFVINSKTIVKATEIAKIKAETDRLLLNIMPYRVLKRIKRGDTRIFDAIPRAAVLFFCIVPSGPHQPLDNAALSETIANLHAIFTQFDDYTDQFECEKIKNVSSTYLAVQFDGDVQQIVKLALSMARHMRKYHTGTEFRIGIDVGSLIAVILGNTKPCYDVVGDVVNVAARLMQTCEPCRIQTSSGLISSLMDMHDNSNSPNFCIVERGTTQIKGKGPMKTYWID